jgi:aromatic ring-cleaving dioxygenase
MSGPQPTEYTLLPDRNPFDVHVYFNDDATRQKAMKLRNALMQTFPWMTFHKVYEAPIGPHLYPMWEADFTHAERAEEWPSVTGFLKENHDGLSILVHPHSRDGGKQDHAEHAFWIGKQLPLEMRVFESS